MTHWNANWDTQILTCELLLLDGLYLELRRGRDYALCKDTSINSDYAL